MERLADIFPEGFSEELDVLDRHLQSQRRQSLPELLRAWDRYAEVLVGRVPVALDDYIAMLFARDAIQDLLQRANPLAGRVLEALISHNDNLFLNATRIDVDEVLNALEANGKKGWWWSRIPQLVER
jgi:hypothetical protein